MLVDSHCHLDFPEFEPELDAVVARAEAAGVGTMLTISTHLSRFERVRAIAERFANVYCTVGVHPHEAAREGSMTVETLTRLAEHPKVVGFGETGLDYYYEHSPREAQQRSFRVHLAAARAAGLPVVIHTRDADDDTARMLAAEHARGLVRGRHPLLQLDAGAGPPGRGPRPLHLFFRDRHLQEGGCLARGGGGGAAGAAAGRDRCAVPGAGAEARQAQRAGVRGPYRRRGGPRPGIGEAALAEATSENFFRLFAKAKRARPTLGPTQGPALEGRRSRFRRVQRHARRSTSAGAAAIPTTRATGGPGRRSWWRRARPASSSTRRRTCASSSLPPTCAGSRRSSTPTPMPITCTASTTCARSTATSARPCRPTATR